MSITLAKLLTFTSVFVSSMGAEWDVVPEDPDFTWEDFDAAISEDDCFGNHCGDASGALSLMQTKAVKVEVNRQAGAEESKEESALTNGVEMEDLKDALASESDGDADMSALNLVQTGASVERTSVGSSHVFGAVQADGSIEINPHKAAVSSSGMMAFSVDVHGGFHAEEGISLIQTEAQVVPKSAAEELTPQTENTLKVRKTAAPSDDAVVVDPNNYEADEGLSLMQTDASLETQSTFSQHETVAGSVQADGTIELNPQKVVVPSNGMMHFSVDAHGDFHSEDAVSMIQTRTVSHSDRTPASAQSVEHMWSVEGHPSWTMEALAVSHPSVDALSLIQTDAHIERKSTSSHQASVVETDGAFEMNPRKPEVPKDGMMHLSVDSHGAFHVEM